MLVRGTVYHSDGKTPPEEIIIYYYHTDNNGHCSPNPTQSDKSKRRGHIRGWVKTNDRGNFEIYTTKPAPYPGRTLRAHIHLIIKEPSINEYYIDNINFDIDSLLTAEMRQERENRSGIGLVKLVENQNGLSVCTRDIILS